jgi:hypothetical protein
LPAKSEVVSPMQQKKTWILHTFTFPEALKWQKYALNIVRFVYLNSS